MNDYVSGVLGEQHYWLPTSHGAGAAGAEPGFPELGNTGDRALVAPAQAGDMQDEGVSEDQGNAKSRGKVTVMYRNIIQNPASYMDGNNRNIFTTQETR